MNARGSGAAVVFALLLGLAPTPGRAADAAAEIRSLWDRASAALCAGDWATYRRLWAPAPYAEVLHPGQRDWRTGWREIEPAYRDLLAAGFRCKVTTPSMRIRVSPRGDMAWATAVVLLRPQGAASPGTLWQSLVFEKAGGAWRLVMAHVSEPAAGGVASEDRAGVDAFFASWFGALERGDPDAILALVADGFVLKPPLGPPITERAALKAALEAMRKSVRQEIEWRIEEATIEGEWAWARVSETARHVPLSGGPAATYAGSHLAILRRTPQGWRLHRDQQSLDRLPAQ